MPGDKRKRDELELESDIEEEEESRSSSDEVFSSEEEDNSDIDEKSSDGGIKNTNKKKISAQEVQAARETAELYHSNIVKMQIDELLGEVEIKESKIKSIERILFKIRDLILSTRNDDRKGELSIKQVLESFSKSSSSSVVIPFPDPKPIEEAQYKFSFINPTDITLCGTFAVKTMIRDPIDGIIIDVAVSMPKEIFQGKDYINYRYFHKRAYYIACLAEHINNNIDIEKMNINYGYMDGDKLRPVILLDVKNPQCTIRISAITDMDVFALRKLEPNRNCVRLKDKDSSGIDSSSSSFPTRNYNNSILLDLSLVGLTGYIFQSAKACPAFRDACKLGSVWLKQRGFSSCMTRGGGFGEWEFGLLMSVLLHGDGKSKSSSSSSRVLLDGFSSFQLFKTTMHYISTRDLVKNPLVFNNNRNDIIEVPKNNSIPQVIDGQSRVNILGKMSLSSYKYLIHESKKANEYLDDTRNNYFDALFLTKVYRQEYQNDVLFTIPVGNGKTDKSYTQYQQVEYPDYKLYYMSKLYNILSMALSDRLVCINLTTAGESIFSIKKRVASSNDHHPFINVGIILDPVNAGKSIILGPHASDEADKGQEFRKFWGERAELRRFKDGSIRESIVWNGGGNIPQQIIEYILKLHLNTSQLNFQFKEIERLLQTSKEEEHSFSLIMNAFNKLTKQLQNLKDIPLIIKIVVGASSTLRYSSIFIPKPFHLHGDGTFNNIVIEFEASSRWPNDLEAIQQTKAAFLIKISKELVEKFPENKTSLGKDLKISENSSSIQQPFLDIFVPQGFVFRIMILYEGEERLFKNLIKTAPNQFIKDNVTDDYLNYRRLLSGSVSHTRAIQTLMYRYQYLSPTIRLLKLWFKSHYLLRLIPDELIELLAANIFINPAPWTVPGSEISGFLRCLKFLSEWDWRSDALIIDLDGGGGEMKNIQLQGDAKSAFDYVKNKDNYSLFVATKFDCQGNLWSQGISKVIGARITSLARACIGILSSSSSQNVDKLFKSPIKDYDFVFELDKHNSGGGGAKEDNELVQDWSPKPVLESSIDYNLLLYKQLKSIYGDIIVLFTNGINIAGIWNPFKIKNDPRQFKVNLGYSSCPNHDDDLVVPNKKAMISEMYRISSDLIKRS